MSDNTNVKSSAGRKQKKTASQHWGQRLGAALAERNLSIRAVAKKVGISPTVISSWIRRGTSPTDLVVVKKMCDFLDVDFCFLLTGERAKGQQKPSLAEIFQETPYFDGYARIRIDRLIPRDNRKTDDTEET